MRSAVVAKVGGVTLRIIPFLLGLALLATGAGASGCLPSSSSPEFMTPSCAVEGAPGCFYVENDPCFGGGAGTCLFSIWVYQETNGVPDLQRQDEVRDDTCGGQIVPDTLTF